VQLSCTAICTTDFSIIEGKHRYAAYPIIPGHEWTGTVINIADAKDRYLIGKRIVAENYSTCGRCSACRLGAWNLCTDYQEIGFNKNGGYAEYLVTRANNVHILPPEIPDEAAALIEPTAVVVHGLQHVQLELGNRLIILGDGPIGLLTIQVARVMGVDNIAVIGGYDNRLALCKEYGAKQIFNYHNEGDNLINNVLSQFGLADRIAETSGSVIAVKQSIELAQRGGKICLVGDYEDKQAFIIPNDILIKNLTIFGITASPGTWEKAIYLIATKKIEVISLVTHRTTLNKFKQALKMVQNKEDSVIKCVFKFG
jgi:L-iditol 2-dehydrogenase